MKILELRIDGYKLLGPNRKIKFGKEIQLLIGVNGSGKSTVLEAVAILFSEVKKYCEDPKIRERRFNFYIEYSFVESLIAEESSTTQKSIARIRKISLSSVKETGLLYSMFVDGEEVKTTHEMYKYLPDNLIFYYAGSCDTLEAIIDITEDEQAKDLYKKTNQKNISKVIDSISKNIIYIRKDYFPLLFALNYIDRELKLPLNGKKFIIRNISFTFKQFKYTKNTDYENLYNLTGFLRIYLDNLLKHSYGVQFDKENSIAYFDVDYHRGILDAVEELPNLTNDQRFNQTRNLAFHFISLLLRIGFIKKINIAITDENDNTYSIDDFSEGEQQLVILDAIKKVLCCKNSALFLDEPDAYLHPQRQRELIPHLKDIFTESHTQIIATTHSPFVAQSVELNSIILFNKKGKIIPNPTETLASYSAITDELFGIKSDFSIEIEEELVKFRNIRTKILNDKEYDQEEFKNVIKILSKNGDELNAIINREVNQLKKLKGNIL